jgi:hypothetical protein
MASGARRAFRPDADPDPASDRTATRPVVHDAYLYVEPRNVAGRASGLTVLTPVPRRWSGVQRFILRLRERAGSDPKLQALALIHFAHWVVIKDFPGQDRRTRYAYLLSCTNFNGGWSSYLDALATRISARLAAIWFTSYGFPGASPPGPFRRYVRANDLPLDHYYSAYPEASVGEVASALWVRDAVDPELIDLADADPAVFGEAWRKFVVDAQRHL